MSLANEIIYGNFENVRELILQGVDVDETDEYGFTPLIETAIADKIEIASFLLNHEAMVDETDTTGRTALHWAVDNHNLPLCKLLLEHKANPNAYTRGGQPILVYPLLRNQSELKKLLYQYGGDADFALDFINAKLLGHRFQLLGQVDIVNNKKQFVELNYEGFFLECTLDIVRNSLERYRNNFAARHMRAYFDYLGKTIEAFANASELLKYQRYTIDIRDYNRTIDGLLNNELLIIPVAYQGHAVTFVRYGNILVRCDRGENSLKEGTVVIYRVNKLKNLNNDFLKWLIYKPQTREYINEGIKRELELETITHLPLSSQITGNCSWANVESSIPTILFLLMLNPKKNNTLTEVSNFKRFSMAFYNEWLEWDKDRALDECVQGFYRGNPARKASKAAILGAVLFQRCNYLDLKAMQRAEKVMPVLTTPEYLYVLKSYADTFWKKRKTDEGNNLMHLLDLCGVKI